MSKRSLVLVQGTKESEAVDEFAHKGIHGDHPFRFEFTQRHLNRPLARAGGEKAVKGQIGALTDAHAVVTNQQKGVATQIKHLCQCRTSKRRQSPSAIVPCRPLQPGETTKASSRRAGTVALVATGRQLSVQSRT